MTTLLTKVPSIFDFQQCLAYFKRSDQELAYQIKENTIYRAHYVGPKPILTVFQVSWVETQRNLKVTLLNDVKDAELVAEVERLVRFWFDLDTPLESFYESVKNDPVFEPLSQQYWGLRLIKIPNLFEAICWAIIGQQINLTFAYNLKNRLISHYGDPIEYDGLTIYSFPTPSRIAQCTVEGLRTLQFSRQKANYIINLAQNWVDQQFIPAKLASLDYPDAVEYITALKGIGNWTAQYVLMRALNHREALPLQDIGLRNALKIQYKLPKQPTLEETATITKQWIDWHSYRTFYLWRSLQNN